MTRILLFASMYINGNGKEKKSKIHSKFCIIILHSIYVKFYASTMIQYSKSITWY